MPKGITSSPEFRAQACRQVLEFSRPRSEVADDLDINVDTQRVWLERARDEGIKMATAEESDNDAEIRRLQAELKQSKDNGTPPAPDLVRRESIATRPGVRLVGDITQIDTWEGPVFLATVIDLFNREVVGWAMADHHRSRTRVLGMRSVISVSF